MIQYIPVSFFLPWKNVEWDNKYCPGKRISEHILYIIVLIGQGVLRYTT